MKRSHRTRTSLLSLGLLALLLAVPVELTYRQVRQERLNRALIAAVKRDDTQMALILLEEGADANARDEASGRRSVWSVMLDTLRGRKPAPSTAPTPLLLSLQWRDNGNVSPPENLTLISALLDHGANAEVRDTFDATPLCHALDERKKATVQLLLAHGVELRPINELSDSSDMDSPNFMAPLVIAAGVFDDSADVLAAMLNHGADVNQRGENGMTALMMAAASGNVAAVQLLLSRHADVHLRPFHGIPTLSCTVVSTEWVNGVKRLYKRYYPSRVPKQGPTALEYAECSQDDPRYRQIIHLLQQAGAKQ